jgi:hypothetical protein
MEELIRHGHLNDKSSFPKLAQLVQTFEEKVNVSSKTEVLLLRLCVQCYDFHIANFFIVLVDFSVHGL